MSTKTVLVTGSSSGFGNSLVNLFLRQGHNVLATSRSPERTLDLVSSVDNHPSGRGKWLQLDLTWPQAKITSTINEAAQIFGPIDVLINNAGYGIMATVEDVDEEKAKTLFETNYWGVMRILKAVVPSMRERKQGTIVNVSSIAGLTANPTVGVYAGSKFALEALTESLSAELSPFNISTLLVEPGAFRTNFLGSTAINYAPLSPAYHGTIAEKTYKAYADMEGNQLGDVEKATQRIYEFVMGEGMAVGKGGSLRLPLGSDCFERATKALKGKLANLEELEGVARSTDSQ